MERQNPQYFSKVFNRLFTFNELTTMQVVDLVLLQDEVSVDLEDLNFKYKTLTKDEKIEGNSPVIAEYRNLRIFAATLKREIYYKSKSKYAGLVLSKEGWKKRARILGEMLGFTKEQIKALVVVNPK